MRQLEAQKIPNEGTCLSLRLMMYVDVDVTYVCLFYF